MSDDLYGEQADTYARISQTSPTNAVYDRPAIVRLAGDLKGRRVLELGCAAGWLTEQLVAGGADVLALDRSPRLVAVTRERVGDRARVEQADLEQPLDLVPDASVEVVVASLVLHYVADWTALLAELRRVLVPGGSLVFSIHHPITGWLLSDRADYHRTELIHETWTWDTAQVRAGMYRRPLSVVLGGLRAAGFAIDAVEEPQPVVEPGADVDPRILRILETQPVFLFVRALRE